jgi:hypothetical protein|tara:strand:- start:207 stop:365 length:159 start_codon:yes stop_codon:yes gene_type:complete
MARPRREKSVLMRVDEMFEEAMKDLERDLGGGISRREMTKRVGKAIKRRNGR